MHGKSYVVSKTTFDQLDLLHTQIETEGLIIELVNDYELLVDWNFSEVAILVQKIVLLACMHRES